MNTEMYMLIFLGIYQPQEVSRRWYFKIDFSPHKTKEIWELSFKTRLALRHTHTIERKSRIRKINIKDKGLNNQNSYKFMRKL